MPTPTKEEVTAKIRELQARLRIQDWDIDFEYVDWYKMKDILNGTSDCPACCEKQITLTRATIFFDQGHWEIEENWEYILAHEMYHIVTEDFRYNAFTLLDFVPDASYEAMKSQFNMHYERLVDTLAKGFVRGRS